MPILPPISPSQYDTVNQVLNATRARVNDAIVTLQPVGGKVLENNQEFTLQQLNNAWRKMQDCLADRGYARLIDEVVIFNLPTVAVLEPASQVWLSWNGYFDGANYFPTPALPKGFTHPLKVWERWSGNNAMFAEPPMEKILDGLPSNAKTMRNRCWEWRQDCIYMPGSRMVQDLRIRFVSYLPDFADQGDLRWFTLPVPIMRGSDALSWYLGEEVAISQQNEALAESFEAKGRSALDHLFNLDVRADQRVNIRRRSRSGRGCSRNYY